MRGSKGGKACKSSPIPIMGSIPIIRLLVAAFASTGGIRHAGRGVRPYWWLKPPIVEEQLLHSLTGLSGQREGDVLGLFFATYKPL
jgi:hypothetical protein